jgi:hypothetical protein
MLQGSPGAATVSAGQTAGYSINLTPEAGFAQKVSFSCAGAPLNSTCTVSPASVTLDGTDNGNATLTVATTGPSGALRAPPRYFAGRWSPSWGLSTVGVGLRAIPPLGILCLMALLAPRRAKKATLWFLSAVLLATLLVACGGGGGSGGAGAGGGGGTPQGTYYNITVTGTTVGGLNHGAIFTLTVN